MARLPRLYAPQIPQLVQAEFAQPLAPAAEAAPAAQLDQLLEWLQRDAREYKVAVHGWLLLNDRIALLCTPPDAQGTSRLVQSLGRRMAAGMRHGRVFSGRYRGALIEPGRWVLPALIWLESLPVQLRYVDAAQRWPWSSAASHMGLHSRNDALLTDHPDYWHDGNTPFARQARYSQRVDQGLSAHQSRRIQDALFGQWVLGDSDFLAQIESRASRRIAPAARGRPRKATPDLPA
jgi:putative transposase